MHHIQTAASSIRHTPESQRNQPIGASCCVDINMSVVWNVNKFCHWLKSLSKQIGGCRQFVCVWHAKRIWENESTRWKPRLFRQKLSSSFSPNIYHLITLFVLNPDHLAFIHKQNTKHNFQTLKIVAFNISLELFLEWILLSLQWKDLVFQLCGAF